MTDLLLQGRTALITGASRGIGAACASAFATAGADIALLGRETKTLSAVADRLPTRTLILEADLRDAEAARRAATRADEEFDGVDVLVNNAGMLTTDRAVEVDLAAAEASMSVNCWAPLALAGTVAQGMIVRGRGSIVNLSSLSGMAGVAYQAAYSATKGAVDAMTRSLACEWGRHGVRVNAVAPGVVKTDMSKPGLRDPAYVKQLLRRVPLGRFATPEDIAAVILFLATDASRYITGQTIVVDGGLSGSAGTARWELSA